MPKLTSFTTDLSQTQILFVCLEYLNIEFLSLGRPGGPVLVTLAGDDKMRVPASSAAPAAGVGIVPASSAAPVPPSCVLPPPSSVPSSSDIDVNICTQYVLRRRLLAASAFSMQC